MNQYSERKTISKELTDSDWCYYIPDCTVEEAITYLQKFPMTAILKARYHYGDIYDGYIETRELESEDAYKARVAAWETEKDGKEATKQCELEQKKDIAETACGD